jgi:hypothetical protein
MLITKSPPQKAILVKLVVCSLEGECGVRLTKRHYLLGLVFVLLGLVVVKPPIPMIAFHVTKVELSKHVYIAGYSPPELLKYIRNDDGLDPDGKFQSLTAPGFLAGGEVSVALKMLTEDGFGMHNSRIPDAPENQDSRVFQARWTDYACKKFMTVVLTVTPQGKLAAADANVSTICI